MKTSREPSEISRGQLLIWISLAAMGAAGLAGIIGGPYLPWKITHEPVKDVSSALLTAAILGATADRFFHADLARDVFRAAFRYVLPDEIKDEVNRIINYRMLCVYHDSSISVEPMDDLMRVTIKSERRMKNISRHTENIRNLLTLDDWGFDTRSFVSECYLLLENGEKISSGPEYNPRGGAVGRHTEYVTFAPGNTVTLISVGTEIKRANDDLMMYYSYPTVSPSVTVLCPHNLDYELNFGVPGEKVRPSPILNKFTLEGTQFPGQHTRLRWWPKRQPDLPSRDQ